MKTTKNMENELDSSNISFEEWNKQFIDNRSLDEFLPEFGMTLGEFRRKIFEAESGPCISKEEFFKEMEKW